MFPASDQETRHTTSGNLPGVVPGAAVVLALVDGSNAVLTHGEVGVSFVQMRTDLS